MSISVVTYNVSDIYADLNWNQGRWKYILDIINGKNPDIIILHEMTNQSTEIFDQLCDKGYIKYIPYLTNGPSHQKRSSWEVIYTKFTVSATFYTLIDIIHGASWIRFIIEREDRSYSSINICATTLYPRSKSALNTFIDILKLNLDPTIMSLISISTGQFGSYLNVPRGISDAWISLGSPDIYKVTLDENLCAHIPLSNIRADHVWSCNLIPTSFEVLDSKGNAEHHGIYTKHIISEKSPARIRRRSFSLSISNIILSRKYSDSSRDNLKLSRVNSQPSFLNSRKTLASSMIFKIFNISKDVNY
jgi:hypothetical protein